MTVWVLTLEWERPTSEMTGDSGIVTVHASEAGARAAQLAERKELHENGELVCGYTTGPDFFCPRCGVRGGVEGHLELDCKPDGVETYCSECGDELTEGDCQRDHDEWTVDVHCTEVEVKP